MGYGSMGGMKLGHIGLIPYGHIGGIHAHSLLLAPNPSADEGDENMGGQMVGMAPQQATYYYYSAAQDQDSMLGQARDNDEAPTPEQMPTMPQPSSYADFDQNSFVGSPMPRAQIDIMSAGPNDNLPMPGPMPTPMLDDNDNMVGMENPDQTGNPMEYNVGASLFRDNEEVIFGIFYFYCFFRTVCVFYYNHIVLILAGKHKFELIGSVRFICSSTVFAIRRSRRR